MFTRTSTPARKTSTFKAKKRPMRVQRSPDPSKDFEHLLAQGKNMNDSEFEMFIKVRARNCYWKLLAARARIQLEDHLRENRQLHELLDQLTKEHEQLQTKGEQYESLNSIFSSMLSECDSGIELHMTGESPGMHRRKSTSRACLVGEAE